MMERLISCIRNSYGEAIAEEFLEKIKQNPKEKASSILHNILLRTREESQSALCEAANSTFASSCAD